MEDMKLFQIILVLTSFFILTNCVGISPQKVNIDKIKKERKLPKPDFFIPDAIYITTGNGSPWNARQFMDFRFWSPPFFDSKESNQHKSASVRPPNDPENVIIFEDIEFDLLEPVLERGPIWRIVDNEEE